MQAEIPGNEAQRLRALESYGVLDTLPEECYDDITHLASQVCGTPIALVSLVDDDRQWFKSRVGLDAEETPRDIAFCAHAILETDLMVVADAREDPRFSDNPLVRGEPRIRFYAGAPLLAPGGEALGTLCVIDRQRRTLSESQADSLRALSRQVMAQLELRRHVAAEQRVRMELERSRRKLEETNERLEAARVTDDVSGFHNTRFLHRYLDACLADAGPEERLSLAFFDMDGFKEVVDTHGHLLGSKVLREVAQAVHAHLDPDDRIVRYGGDEYVVILPHQSGADAAAKVERMRRAIRETPFLRAEGIHIRVTASFGLATFPDDARDKRELLMEADRRLFRSKEAGRDRVTRLPGVLPVEDEAP